MTYFSLYDLRTLTEAQAWEMYLHWELFTRLSFVSFSLTPLVFLVTFLVGAVTNSGKVALVGAAACGLLCVLGCVLSVAAGPDPQRVARCVPGTQTAKTILIAAGRYNEN